MSSKHTNAPLSAWCDLRKPTYYIILRVFMVYVNTELYHRIFVGGGNGLILQNALEIMADWMNMSIT